LFNAELLGDVAEFLLSFISFLVEDESVRMRIWNLIPFIRILIRFCRAPRVGVIRVAGLRRTRRATSTSRLVGGARLGRRCWKRALVLAGDSP
jgi:hypothetical protein